MNRQWKIFTLIELLIVISIIAILSSLLLPALKNAMKSAKTIACSNQMKQLHAGNLMYAQDYDGWLPGSRKNAYWRTLIYPYVGGNKNYKAGVWSDIIKIIAEKKVYTCPSLKIENSNGVISGIGYNYYYMGYDESDLVKLLSVPHPSKTILLSDTNDYSLANTFNHYHVYTPARLASMGHPMISRHIKGLNISFVDGHVEWQPTLSLKNNPDLYKRVK